MSSRFLALAMIRARSSISHVVINRASSEHLGYMAVSARPIHSIPALPEGYDPKWNSMAEILSFHKFYGDSNLFMFHIISIKDFPEFSLFICEIKYSGGWHIPIVIRKGLLLHFEELISLKQPRMRMAWDRV